MHTLTMCYIHVPGDARHNELENRFLKSYEDNPPGEEHKTIIVCQGAIPHKNTIDRYRSVFPKCMFLSRGGEGMDIGAYMDCAKTVDTQAMLCVGGSTHFRRPGWMKRMTDSWHRYGIGFYGALSSYQVRPHFNTTGFWTSPDLLLAYPRKIITTPDRYDFEHGDNCLWWQLHQQGLPCKLVTWCGEYDWPEWRQPQNISCRGDQSNCLMWFRINDQFDYYRLHDPVAHNNLMYLTDAHILDPKFRYPTWELSLNGGG